MAQPPSGGQSKVLFVGGSWVKHTIHLKGFDQFHDTEYEEGAPDFFNALATSGFDVTYIRAHEISSRFPRQASAGRVRGYHHQ
ncbi:glutamine amidotransferase [Pseudonocardia sp. NPDC046786]|uniref:glutamine amidotransferase n=1 Tax=Pseudonocardia sp. NPDC046786 TaxID=3155471 RepID=UPI0033F0D764